MSSPLTLDSHATQIKGELVPPGDKSISHRAVIFGSISKGTSSYTHFLQSEDCLHTMQAFQAMGVSIRLDEKQGRLEIDGAGLHGLKAPERELYLGNSGTSMRLLMGLLSGQRFEVTLTGDDSLSSRPMKRVTVPLKQMGAQIKGGDKGNFAPLQVRGGKLQGIEFDNKLGSAQVKSAILLAGLYAEGKTRIHEDILSRDHTERFLSAAGANFRKLDGGWMEIEKTDELQAMTGKIPGDMSSAAFFITGAAMTPGSEIIIRDVSLNDTRTGLLDVLKRMGAKIEVTVENEVPEPIGTVRIWGGPLRGTRIEKAEIPSLIDELPIIMVAMAVAEGESIISGAEELRVKETDRIASMAANLTAVGADIDELPDGVIIRGGKPLSAGAVKSYGDHRTVMSMVIASLVMSGTLEIDDTRSVATSYPGFFEDFGRLAVRG